MRRRRWKRRKWIGTAICALTILVTGAWMFVPNRWRPYPEYFGPRWGFKVWRKDIAVYVTTIISRNGRPVSEWHGPAWFAATNRTMLESNPDPLRDYDYYSDVRLWPQRSRHSTDEKLGFKIHQDRLFIPLISIPLLVLLLAVPLTALFWWLDRWRPGFCRECGYNLTGNVSGRCPECGLLVPGSPDQDAGESPTTIDDLGPKVGNEVIGRK